MNVQIALPIEDASHVASARRRALRLMAPFAFDASELGHLSVIVTEAATNILKHAGQGRILLRPLERGSVVGLELIALDKGPGITNIDSSMRDGVSTAGSSGTGLGALRRLSTHFEIYSRPQQGTALRLELWPGAAVGAARSANPSTAPGTSALIEWGGICVAKPREEISGDDWTVCAHAEQRQVLVVDGLGHGPEAARAARAAVELMHDRAGLTPLQLINAMHGALASTRGAAIGIAALDPVNGRGTFAGVGNIAAIIDEGNGTGRHLVSFNGIVGHKFGSVREIPFAFPKGALLILHSDGLATQWDLSGYPGLRARHPALLAAVLCRDFERGRDDVTVVALRHVGH